jgi:hypothetical protein
LQHLAGGRQHPQQVIVRSQRRFPSQLHHPGSNADAHIAYPLQIDDQLQGRGQQPQVTGHGLPARQDLQTEVVDFQLHGVRLLVPEDDPIGQLAIVFQQRLSAGLQDLVHLPAHLEDLLSHGLELGLELMAGVLTEAHPNLPVMYSSV